MKKQNANNKLAFGKAAVTELSSVQLDQVNGGSGTHWMWCPGCLIDLIADAIN